MSERTHDQIIAAVMNDPAVQKVEQQALSAIRVYQSDAAAVDAEKGLSNIDRIEKLQNSPGIQAADYMEFKARTALAEALEKQGVHGVDVSGNDPLANALRNAFKDKVHADLTQSGPEVTAADRQNVQDLLKDKVAFTQQIVAEVTGNDRVHQYEEQAASVQKALQNGYGDRKQEMTELYFLESETRGAIADVMKKHGVTFDAAAESGLSRDVTVAMQAQIAKDSPVSDQPLSEKDRQNIEKVTADLAAYHEAHQGDYGKPGVKPVAKAAMDGPS